VTDPLQSIFTAPIGLLTGLLIGLLPVATVPAVAQTNSLDSLPLATQEEISQVCLPVQFREGASAYRNCVQSEINLRSRGSTTELGQLSFDDKYAVQQACANAGEQSSDSYQSCVATQIRELNQIAAPTLYELSEDELYVVQQSCFDAQSQQGAASYRQCLNNEMESLLKIPATDTSNLNMLKKNALQLRCSESSSNAAQYRQCISDQYKSIVGTEPNFLPTNPDAGTTSQATDTVSNAQGNASGGNVTEQNNTLTLAESQIPATQIAVTEIVEQPTIVDVVEPTSEPLNSEPTMSLPRNINPATDSTVLSNSTEPDESTAALPVREQTTPTATQTDITNETIKSRGTTDTTNETSELPSVTNITNETINSPSVSALPETTDNTVSTNSQRVISEAETRVISRPKLVETLEIQAQANAQGAELKSSANADTSPTAAALPQNTPPMQKLGELWQKLRDSLASMNAIGWLLIAAVLALPAILLGLFSIIGSLRKTSPAIPEYAPAHNIHADGDIYADHETHVYADHETHVERAEPGLRSRRLRHEQEAATLFDDEIASDRSDAMVSFDDEMASPDNESATDHDAITRISTKSDRQRASNRQPASANGTSQIPAHNRNSSSEQTAADTSIIEMTDNDDSSQSDFGNWLLQQPEANRMESCIEFLIYWVAYGDDRYQPDLKQRLFTDTELSSNDKIKRWVLKQDVYAFADVVAWLRTNATQIQLDQIVALLMALLVSEHSITPVQNTVLRFLADAFNIGKSQLEQRFDMAFGHPMPAIPRTDKYLWWKKQEPELMQRWEARFMATRSENEQMIARLGLAANYDEAQVINSFRRAARRCHPDRFTELGDRERTLAEQQFIKFEQARDKLLGVSV